jgi:acetyltransferase-like isoleucine patch superfamily enzyme
MKFNSRNIYISPNARVGNNVRIGDNTVIYDNVHVGDNSTICNDCILGEPLNEYYRDEKYENPPTFIGRDSVVRSHSIIYASCRIGDAFNTGHRVIIRENSIIGNSCSVGSLTDIEGEVKIGNYCRLHSNVHLSQTSSLGDFVWMYPFSVMTNDPYPPSYDIQGGHVGSYTQVCVHSTILAGVRVGENCLIGANSVVNKTLPDYSLAMGDPIRIVRDLRRYVVMGKGKPYPWMYRFDRGMPWRDIGYDAWTRLQLGAPFLESEQVECATAPTPQS